MQQGTTLPGDILLVTAFICELTKFLAKLYWISCFLAYVGCFTKQFRLDLLQKNWLPFLRAIEPPIPITGKTFFHHFMILIKF